ncbi:MAG TPA: DoxX family protein [Vicinamibacterales bacterium]|nr:DoxX family protein [Vicinamibacterales bacterium]
MAKLRSAAVWAGAIFLAVAFVAVGLSKLEGASAIRWSERFGQWGYPANAAYVVGVLEIVAGFGLLIPRRRRAASLTLSVLMAGALCTHLVHAEFPRVIPPLVLGGVAFLMYWSQRRPTEDG